MTILKHSGMFLLVRPYLFAKAAITKYYSVGGLNNRNLFPPSSGSWKFKVKVFTGLVSPGSSSLGLQLADFLLCPHMAFPLSMYIPGVAPLIRMPSYWNSDPSL